MHRSKSVFFSLIIAMALLALVGIKASASGEWETGSVRDVRGFDSVSLDTSGELIITQGDREGLEIEATPSDLRRIITEVRGGTLHIDRERGFSSLSFDRATFRLTMKTIAGLETHSSGKITVNNLRAGSLRIQISSSGGISIDSLAADSLDAQISSSGSLAVAGKADQQNVRISSSGNYSAGKLASRTANVEVSSSGDATLRVSDSLEARISSSGEVRYYGNPPRVSSNTSSSGRLVKLGD